MGKIQVFINRRSDLYEKFIVYYKIYEWYDRKLSILNTLIMCTKYNVKWMYDHKYTNSVYKCIKYMLTVNCFFVIHAGLKMASIEEIY